MLGENKSGMLCTEFDALLTEAVDGTLKGEQRLRFEQHQAGCAACEALFAEVARGAAWLHEMEDVAPPRMLVQNILAATSGAGQAAAKAEEARTSAWERLRRQVSGMFAPVLTPRFGMSLGMAFFSVTLVLNMAQIRIRDLTPHNLSHTFYSSQNKVMKYYENMRLVYEIESRVRDLRNASEENEREREERSRHHEKNNNQTQEQNQNNQPQPGGRQDFSLGQSWRWLASMGGREVHIGELAMQRREI
jgi:hypothetical protein